MLNYHKSVVNGTAITNVNGTIHVSQYDGTALVWFNSHSHQIAVDIAKSTKLPVRYHYRTWGTIESVDYDYSRRQGVITCQAKDYVHCVKQ